MLHPLPQDARRAEYKALTDGSSRTAKAARRNSAPAIAAAPQLLLQNSLGNPSAIPYVVGGLDDAGTAVAAAEVSRAPSGTRPPFLIAMSCATGGHAGGTSVWLQGSQFTAQTRVYVGGLPAPNCNVISDSLVTIITPPAAPGTGPVEVRARGTHAPRPVPPRPR